MPDNLTKVNYCTYQATLTDNPTTKQLWEALPLEGSTNIWGEEINFEIPLVAPQYTDARSTSQAKLKGIWMC